MGVRSQICSTKNFRCSISEWNFPYLRMLVAADDTKCGIVDFELGEVNLPVVSWNPKDEITWRFMWKARLELGFFFCLLGLRCNAFTV